MSDVYYLDHETNQVSRQPVLDLLTKMYNICVLSQEYEDGIRPDQGGILRIHNEATQADEEINMAQEWAGIKLDPNLFLAWVVKTRWNPEMVGHLRTFIEAAGDTLSPVEVKILKSFNHRDDNTYRLQSHAVVLLHMCISAAASAKDASCDFKCWVERGALSVQAL